MTGSWFGGWPLAQFAAARPEGFVCGRGRCASDDTAYLFAAAGVPLHRMESQRLEHGAPAGAPFEVPGEKGGIDLWNPQGMALVKANAAEVGKANAQNPLIVSYQMDNERRFPFSHGLCPTAAADASFRQWCRKQHGELATLNRRWGTAYKSWDEVEQPASARYAEEVMKQPKPARGRGQRLDGLARQAHPGDPASHDGHSRPRHGLGALADFLVALGLRRVPGFGAAVRPQDPVQQQSLLAELFAADEHALLPSHGRHDARRRSTRPAAACRAAWATPWR